MRQHFKIKLAAYPLVALCMSACTLTPDVPASNLAEPSETWPELLPIAQLAALQDGLETRPQAVQAETETLNAAVAALRARAARLNGPILTDQERQRLAQAAATR